MRAAVAILLWALWSAACLCALAVVFGAALGLIIGPLEM